MRAGGAEGGVGQSTVGVVLDEMRIVQSAVRAGKEGKWMCSRLKGPDWRGGARRRQVDRGGRVGPSQLRGIVG